MGKTIAVIGSLDTKQPELQYMVDEIHRLGYGTLLFDTSGLKHTVNEPAADITNQEIALAAGCEWDSVSRCTKERIMEIITTGVKITVRKYYEEGRFQGIISAGGLQNTFMAKSAMSVLPYGFPKVTVAAPMAVVEVDDAMGRMDDVSTVSSIADIGGGTNTITAGIMTNGIAALIGMMEYGKGEFKRTVRPLIGIMNLGVMAKGAIQAADILRQNGIETCMFHGTMHGAVVEKLVRDGILDGVMMLCIHDILTEAIGTHSFCRVPVLKAPAEKKIPTLVSLSGMDVIDMSADDFCPEKIEDYENRKYFYHNDFCVHVKTNREEILKGAGLLAERLNAFDSPVTVAVPLRGFRSNTQIGEALYDPEVDGALIQYLHENLKHTIRIVDVDANANDMAFSREAAKEMLRLLKTGEGENDL